MAKSDEKGLELLEMIKMRASFKEGEDIVIKIELLSQRNHVIVFLHNSTLMAP